MISESINKGKIRILSLSVIAVIFAFMYHNCFVEMWARWFPAWDQADLSLLDRLTEGESYYTHGPLTLVVSIITAIFILRKSKILTKPAPATGILILLTSLIFHIIGTFARINFVSAMTILTSVLGIILILFGYGTARKLWFPMVFLIFMVPLPEVMIAEINFNLKMLAANWGVHLANYCKVICVHVGNQAYLEGGKTLVIANVCNGLRTIISLLGFSTLYSYMCRLNIRGKLLIFAISAPLAIGINAMRVTALIIAADIKDTKFATGTFHDMTGLLIFAVAMIIMFSLESLMLKFNIFRNNPVEKVTRHQTYQLQPIPVRVRYFAIVLSMLVMASAVVWFIDGTLDRPNAKLVYTPQMPTTLTLGQKKYTSYAMQLDRRTMTILENPEYIYRRFVEPEYEKNHLDLCVIMSRRNRKAIHPPNLCLEGSGREVIAQRTITVVCPDGTIIPCRELLVQSGKSKFLYLYTYKYGTDFTSSFLVQQLKIVQNSLLSRDTSGALLRVSCPVFHDDFESARNRLSMLLRSITPGLVNQF